MTCPSLRGGQIRRREGKWKAGKRTGWDELVELGFHVELDAVALVELADTVADVLAQDRLERRRLHPDDLDIRPLSRFTSASSKGSAQRLSRTLEAAIATSIPINELPTTTNLFFSPSPLPIAASIFLASSMFRRVKMPFKSEPGMGRVLAREPVLRIRWE